MSLWLDLGVIPQEAVDAMANQPGRRFVKTHLPVDALVYSPRAKYLSVGRVGRDTAFSLYNHHANTTDDYFAAFNDTPGRVGPRLERGTSDAYGFYRAWFDGDGFPYWAFWENVRSWWAIRHLPNVLMVHFNDMLADLPGQIRRIATFLDITLNPSQFPAVVEHCSFACMKANSAKFVPGDPHGPDLWREGGNTFIHKGSNGRWRDSLTPADISAYEARALRELGPEGARWLAQGGTLGPQP